MTRPAFPRSPRSLRLLVAATLLLAAAGIGRSAAAQQLSFTPYHGTGIYAVGEKIGWTVVPVAGQSAAAGAYTYTVKRDGLALLRTGTLDLASGKATIETSLDRPGMVLVEVRPPAGTAGFHGESKAEDGRVLLGAAVAPTKIRPSEPKPADFDSFWVAKIARLHAVPAAPLLTPGESGTPGVEWATIRMNNIDGAHVWGQLAKPAREGKFPALLILQWASPPYPLQKVWVTSRAAEGWLVLNVEPHDVPADMPQAFYDALPQIIKNYNTVGQLSREENYFLAMYLGDYRAVDYLAGRPDWDGRTLVVMGTSMGGQQSLAVAGLHPQVTGMIVNVPAGNDVSGPLHGRAAPYPNFDVARPEIHRAGVYFDANNFAPRIKVPSLVGMGFIDETCPPAGIWASFNEIQGRKEAVPMFDSPHNHMATPAEQAPITRRTTEWLDALVHGREPVGPSPTAAGPRS